MILYNFILLIHFLYNFWNLISFLYNLNFSTISENWFHFLYNFWNLLSSLYNFWNFFSSLYDYYFSMILMRPCVCKQPLATVLLCICCSLYRFFFANGCWVRQIKLLRSVQTIHSGYGFGPSFKLVGSSHFGPLTFMELQMVTLNSG